MISNSGEVDEVVSILPAIKRVGVTLVGMTGRADSTLASHADIVLDTAVDQEACPLNLAPTASTTVSRTMAAVRLTTSGLRRSNRQERSQTVDLLA